MKKIFTFLLMTISIAAIAQTSPSVITAVDYYNATRYTGARNIARTTDGYLMVVFEPGTGYPDNQEIRYAYYNKAFDSWDLGQLSSSTTNATGVPAIIADESGHLYAAWKEKAADGKRNAMSAKCVFTDAFTYTWSAPVVSDNIDNNAGVLTIDLSDNNDIFILFSIWNDPPVFDANIYASRSVNDGSTWTTSNLTSVFPTPNELPLNYLDVSLTPGENGEMYAAWEDYPSELTNQYEILFSHFTPSGGWSEPNVVSPLYDGDPNLNKYADGCTLIGDASSIYEMGPAGYQFAGKSTVFEYFSMTSQVLSTCFNPYYIRPVDDRTQFVQDVVNYFGLSDSDDILVVDDDNRFNNEWVITDALDDMGRVYTVFDCGDNSGMATDVPTASDLNDKELVIWFTGDDSNNLAFWNVADEDNQALIDYLDIEGSRLWIVGRDFIYDRYGTAPDNFSAGDFCYDYLGIDSYDVQSWADDGNTGLEQLDYVAGAPGISTVAPISWGMGGIRQGEPSIATDYYNMVHMAYYDANGSHIMYQMLTGGTEDWTTPIQIDNTAADITVMRPSIAIDQNQGIYIVWMQQTDDVGGNKLYNVFYATSPDGGTTWNAPQQLSNTTYIDGSGYSVRYPTIGKKVRKEIDGVFEGGADVVWNEASSSSSLGYNIMYARIPYVGSINTPVELTSFNAEYLSEREILLTWETVTETNNKGFEIQRALSNLSRRSVAKTDEQLTINNWETVGFVEGNGTTDQAKKYSFIDSDFSLGENYKYRLKQIDFDGTYQYSNIVEVETGLPDKFELRQNYPNPFFKNAGGNPTTTIEFTIPSNSIIAGSGATKQSAVKLVIYNSIGQQVAELINKSLAPGNYKTVWRANNMPSGLYIAELRLGKIRKTIKMLLLK